MRTFPEREDMGRHFPLPQCRDTAARPCYPVVEEHQGVVVVPEVPTVTIKTRYSEPHAWTYEAIWTSSGGVRRVRSGTGFPSRGSAKEEAEERATNAILEELPDETYTFTPKI